MPWMAMNNSLSFTLLRIFINYFSFLTSQNKTFFEWNSWELNKQEIKLFATHVSPTRSKCLCQYLNPLTQNHQTTPTKDWESNTHTLFWWKLFGLKTKIEGIFWGFWRLRCFVITMQRRIFVYSLRIQYEI